MEQLVKEDTASDFTLEPIDSQCLPYACHYNEHTILNKNGELLQVIKLEGYSPDNLQKVDELDLRSIIRKSILEKVEDSKVTFWFHTLRRKRNLDSLNYYSWTFAKDNHEAWVNKNHWRDKYVNELYISVLYEGESLNNEKNFRLSFIPKLLKSHHLNILNQTSKKLDGIVEGMLDILGNYGGKRLTIKHDNLGIYSEILGFLSKIICLKGKRVPLPIQNIENIFSNSYVVFGGNTVEIVDNNEKKFAALFTIKEYQEFASKALDRFMQIASEYIFSQTLSFVDNATAKKEFDYLDYILGISKDENLRVGSGLSQFLESDRKKNTDYGSQQMTMMLIADSIEELHEATVSFSKEISKLGVVVIREDIHIALCYWSLLPGNFHFFKRSTYINTSRSASFVSLHNTPTGVMNNIWGPATIIFRKINGSPHFFNLHVGNSGHMIISGTENSDKTLLTNFILSECTKYEPRILYLDQNNTSLVTIKAIGGKYAEININSEKPSFKFNPFLLPESEENIKFLLNWLLIICVLPESDNLELKKILQDTLTQLQNNIPLEKRNISEFLKLIEGHKLTIIYDYHDEKPQKNEIILYLNKDERLITIWSDTDSFPVEGNDDSSKGIPTILLRKIITELKKKNKSTDFNISFLEERQIINFITLRTGRLYLQEKIITSLSNWVRPGKYGLIFDNDYEEFDSGTKTIGISFKELITDDNRQAIAPLMYYILHKFRTLLDNTPTILVINDINFLLAHDIFKDYLTQYLNDLDQKNSIAIVNYNIKSPLSEGIKNILDRFVTKIFFPYVSTNIYQETFQLNDNETGQIAKMRALYRHFMIKQNDENIIAELNLDGLDHTLESLSGKKRAITAVEKAIVETKTTNPNRWISSYYKFLDQETN